MMMVNSLGRGCWVYPIYIASFSAYPFDVHTWWAARIMLQLRNIPFSPPFLCRLRPFNKEMWHPWIYLFWKRVWLISTTHAITITRSLTGDQDW